MYPQETVGANQTKCMDCKAVMDLKVCRSAAGYYLGFWCNSCGPYSRESGYFATREQAEQALKAERASWERK